MSEDGGAGSSRVEGQARKQLHFTFRAETVTGGFRAGHGCGLIYTKARGWQDFLQHKKQT